MYAREKLGAWNSWYRLTNILYTVAVGMCVYDSLWLYVFVRILNWVLCCVAYSTLESGTHLPPKRRRRRRRRPRWTASDWVENSMEWDTGSRYGSARLYERVRDCVLGDMVHMVPRSAMMCGESNSKSNQHFEMIKWKCIAAAFRAVIYALESGRHFSVLKS